MMLHSLTIFLLCLLNVLHIRAQCSAPDISDNRVLTDSIKRSYSDGDTLTYLCPIGYQPVDPRASKSITCSGNTWTELALQCKKRSCGPLPEISNGRYIYSPEGDEGILFGSTAKAQCNEGYVLAGQAGNANRNCRSDGWDGRDHSCEDSQAQQVKVQPEVVSHEGQVVTLPCQFLHPGQTKVTQMSWIFETAAGARNNIAMFHPVYGVVYPTSPVKGRVSFTADPPQLESPAIQITDIKKTDKGKYICEYATYPSGNLQGITNLIILDPQAKQVKVQPEVESHVGHVVTLPCQFLHPDQTKLTQMSWIFETAAGARNNIAMFHPVYGVVYPTSPVKGRVSFTADPPQLESPAIQITDMKKTDKGKYICEYATYPSGNLQGVTNLIILDPQVQRVKVQPEVVSLEGQVVTLPCQFLDPGQTKLTQVSWIFETAAGARSNIAVFYPKFGGVYPTSPVTGRVSFTTDPPQLESPAIQITDIKITDEGRYICEYAIYPCGIEQGVTNLIILGPLAQRVKVQPEVVSFPGKVVTLRCLFPDPGQIQYTQVSWIYETAAGARSNIAMFHPAHGVNYPTSPVKGRVSFMTSPPGLSPTIQITHIKKTDEGRYICEYATYPSGTLQGVTNLIILAQCERPSVGANRVLTPESVKQSYSDGDTAVFQCSVGYQPVDPRASKSITCSGNKWTDLALQCKRVPCPVEPIKDE